MAFLRILAALLALQPVPQAGSAEAAGSGVRFGVLSIAPPARIHAKWQGFTAYLSQQLGKPVSIVVPRGFGKMKQAVNDGQVDFFYVNSHVFYRLKQEGKVIGVAQMENIDGKTTSRSEIYVRADSGIQNLDQLKDKRIAFISPMGAGGYLAPRAYLYSHGVKSGTDGEEVFTRNLSNSIHQVLLGDTDAGTMCGVNYRLMSEKVDTGELRVLALSDEYPENVIGARDGLAGGLVKRVREIIVGMADSPDGQKVLAGMHGMKVRRFLHYDPAAEALTRTLLEQAQLKP